MVKISCLVWRSMKVSIASLIFGPSATVGQGMIRRAGWGWDILETDFKFGVVLGKQMPLHRYDGSALWHKPVMRAYNRIAKWVRSSRARWQCALKWRQRANGCDRVESKGVEGALADATATVPTVLPAGSAADVASPNAPMCTEAVGHGGEGNAPMRTEVGGVDRGAGLQYMRPTVLPAGSAADVASPMGESEATNRTAGGANVVANTARQTAAIFWGSRYPPLLSDVAHDRSSTQCTI